MLPEIGSFAIILALCFALLQSVYGWLPNHFFKISERESVRVHLTMVTGQFIFLIGAMLCLIVCFLKNDLTIIYVREHSHHLLPLLYRIGAAWGGHEGSLLLWCLILSGWAIVFSYHSNNKLNPAFFIKVTTVLGTISTGFILFLFLTSNPFAREFPTSPIVGDDLTPILQDPGLIFHPPMLYMGYVGFAITFSFAIAALLSKRFESNWAFVCRPWIILPWSFLSCGIVLGSWWAYRELGWGGWWFWDPVENASLLPWLAATALLHSLIVTEKRAAFAGWTILLAIITFALSLIGTFLVRSGVLVSVHTFASDPSRGLFLLIYLATIVGSALFLYGTRIQYFYQPPRFKLFSRETFLLLNSIILLTLVLTIVLGTLYPIILDALNLEKISVGEPYFNTIFVPLILPLLFLMGIAPHIHWQQHGILALISKIKISLTLSILLGLTCPLLFGFEFNFLASVGIALGLWIIISTVQYCLKQSFFGFQQSAMVFAHIGIAILAIGISVNKAYSQERQIKMSPSEQIELAGFQFHFSQLNEVEGDNFKSIQGLFEISKNNHVRTLTAEQRVYHSHQQILSKPGIVYTPWQDLYLALGTPLDDNSWAIRIYYKPLVRWIWAGGFLLLIGGLLSLAHYLRKRT